LQHDAIVIGRALLCGLALAGAPGLAQAQSTQNWPQHTVRLITPLGPGSGMDVAARLFAERLSQKWGQPVVVENRQGADGILAVQSFLSDRDNHSLIFGFAGLHSINPILHGDKLPYDVRDVVPVASAIDSTLALTVSEAAKVNSLAEFVALAKAQPGKLNWAATTGLPLYVVAALQKVAGIDITQISYRDFGPAFQDFATGRVPAGRVLQA
jgi:tripartite-type tricarboxylate transporter receptor subunit TctC